MLLSNVSQTAKAQMFGECKVPSRVWNTIIHLQMIPQIYLSHISYSALGNTRILGPTHRSISAHFNCSLMQLRKNKYVVTIISFQSDIPPTQQALRSKLCFYVYVNCISTLLVCLRIISVYYCRAHQHEAWNEGSMFQDGKIVTEYLYKFTCIATMYGYST